MFLPTGQARALGNSISTAEILCRSQKPRWIAPLAYYNLLICSIL